MPENRLEGALPEGGQQGTTLRVQHAQDVKTSYSNMCLLLNTRDELIMDFGLLLMGGAAPGREQPREANMVVSNRIIMGMRAAKQLAIALSQAIQRYENTFGVIELEPRPAAPPAAGRPSGT